MSRSPTDGDRLVVLLVEDDAGDQELARRAMKAWRRPTDLRIVGDGEQALDYLLRRGDFASPASSPRPHLVLLDLHMPKVDGSRVLAEMRARPALPRSRW